MITSTAPRSTRPSLQLLQLPLPIDKPVLPAFLHHILQGFTLNALSHDHNSTPPNVVLLSLLHPPSHFESLFTRLSLPTSCIVDAFSQYYPLPQPPSSTHYVHIAPIKPCAKVPHSVVSELREALTTSRLRDALHRVIVIDSLDVLLEYWPGMETVLDFVDGLATEGEMHTVSVVAVYRGADISLGEGLRRLAGTHTVVKQTGKERELVEMHVCRRKKSGRVSIERLIGKMNWKEGLMTSVNKVVDKKIDKGEEKKRQEDMMDQLGLSFRVALSSKEREIRAKAGLPYLHKDEKLADSGLILHPKELQIGGTQEERDGNSEYEDQSEDEWVDEDGEELFSEDV